MSDGIGFVETYEAVDVVEDIQSDEVVSWFVGDGNGAVGES